MTEQEMQALIDARVEEKTQEFIKKVGSLVDSVVLGLATVVESRDNSTGGHIRRTSECVKTFMEALADDPDYDFDRRFVFSVIKAAPMHDLGKLAVPDAILQKKGRFTPEEYEQMKGHSRAGAKLVYEVLSEIPDAAYLKLAVNVAHYHHEKWDGSGYPAHLSGEQIPMEARIMALADVFDALVSKRCYKESYSYDRAFSIIEESLGTHFDPKLGAKFVANRPKFEALYDQLFEEEDLLFALQNRQG